MMRLRGADTSAKAALLDGYLAVAKWSPDQQDSSSAGKSIESFSATWRVPDPPKTDTSRGVLLFIGMQAAESNPVKSILQPVLQWEADSEGKNHEWSVASYFVYGTRPVGKFLAMTKPIRVAPGDVLRAVISLQAKGNGMFAYGCEFTGISGSELYIQSPNELVQVGVALEVSEVMQLTDLPSSDVTRFERVEISLNDDTKASPIWDITNLALAYDVRAVSVAHNGRQDEVDIFYR
jgi:hypothetical protein